MEEVTDPAVLAQLNSGPSQEVTDPKLLDALNSTQSPMESAGRAFVRNFPMAQQAAAAIAPINPLSDKSNYSDELQHLSEAAEQGKEQNPISYGAGAVAGSLAPMAIPVAGEALGLAGPALEAAGGAGVAGGALTGATQAVSDTNLVKNPGQAAGQAALGAGVGGIIGKIGNGIRAIAPSEDALGASMTGTGLGFNARGAQRLMSGANPEADVATLGKWANTTMTPEGKALAEYVRPGEKLKALGDIHDAAGKEIGAVLDKVAPGASLPKATLTKDLYPLADELETLAPKEHSDVMGVINKINKLSDQGRLDLPALNKIKSFVGAASADNPTMQRVYGALSDSVNNVIDEYGRVIGDPADRAAFDAARTNYRNSSQLLPILRKAEGREIAQGPLGNSGLLGMIGGAGALAAGHPVGAAATMAGSAVGRPIVNTIGRSAMLRAVPNAGAIAGAGRGLNQAAQTELENFLASKFGKKE